MRILIDIGHPAHVHYFRNLAEEFSRRGDKVLFTTREKEVSINLLDHYGFQYASFGKPYRSRLGKVFGLFRFTLSVLYASLKFKPDIFLNATPYSAVVAWLLRKPHISLEDTFNMEQVRLYLPFTDVVLTGSYPHPSLGAKEVRYDGYQELTYLHPKRFTPDPGILKEMGVQENEKYIILRFISWRASHDFGSRGLSPDQKRELIDALKVYAKVFISAEGELPVEFEPYRLSMLPYRIHDVLAFASLYIGEGATMASECAMVGTPAIYINPQDVFTIQEQEKKYELISSFRDFHNVTDKAVEWLRTADLKKTWRERRHRMLSDKIDLTAFLIWFVDNFPESMSIMRTDPAYQSKFR